MLQECDSLKKKAKQDGCSTDGNNPTANEYSMLQPLLVQFPAPSVSELSETANRWDNQGSVHTGTASCQLNVVWTVICCLEIASCERDVSGKSHTMQYIEMFWLKPAADELCDVLALCDQWVSVDLLQYFSVQAQGVAEQASQLIETIHQFGGGIVESYLLPLLHSSGRIETRETEGRTEVAIGDKTVRHITSRPPVALPSSMRQRDAANVLYHLLMEVLKLKLSDISEPVHREAVQHAMSFLSLADRMKGLLTPRSLIYFAASMVEPLARSATLAEADQCAVYCMAQIMSYFAPQSCVTPKMDPCLQRMHLVEAHLLRARQQRRLGHPKTSLHLLDTAESLQLQIKASNGGNFMAFVLKVTRAETLSYCGIYGEALVCLQSIEDAVHLHDRDHQCQYWLTRAGICYYLGYYVQSEACYKRAIQCVLEGDNYQKALVLSLAARVAAKVRPEKGLEFDVTRLDKAEQQCLTARELLHGSGTNHRYWGVLERSFALIYTAKAAQALPHDKSLRLVRAMQHACNALKCLITVYGARNVNVAMTLEVMGEIAAIVVNIPEQDRHRRAVVDRLRQKYLETVTSQLEPRSPIESMRELSLFFYEQAIELYQDCCRDHPACSAIRAALRKL